MSWRRGPPIETIDGFAIRFDMAVSLNDGLPCGGDVVTEDLTLSPSICSPDKGVQLKKYAGIHHAAALVRTQDRDPLPEVRRVLRSLFIDGVLLELRDPLAAEVIDPLDSMALCDRAA